MENINEILKNVPEHLLTIGTPIKKPAQADILYFRDKFGGVKFYKPSERKEGYIGPAVVQESINKAREKYNP